MITQGEDSCQVTAPRVPSDNTRSLRGGLTAYVREEDLLQNFTDSSIGGNSLPRRGLGKVFRNRDGSGMAISALEDVLFPEISYLHNSLVLKRDRGARHCEYNRTSAGSSPCH
jgi:hypothetical protein